MRPLIQETVVRLFAALGVVAGAAYGLYHQAHVSCSSHGTAATVIGRCTNRSLIAIGLHWGIALGGGLVTGGVLGIVLAVGLRPRTA
jgi:hypothetical protein